MKQLVINPTIVKDGHHMYIYDGKGHKCHMADDGVSMFYKSTTGMLKGTEFIDRAGSIKGSYVITDEVKTKKGKPCIDGRTYDIFGAGSDFVYLTASRDVKYHTKNVSTDTKVTVTSKNNPQKKADCELLRQIWVMLP